MCIRLEVGLLTSEFGQSLKGAADRVHYLDQMSQDSLVFFFVCKVIVIVLRSNNK